jgi:hypothetical protein
MRFHIVCHTPSPVTKDSTTETVVIELRDALKPAASDEEISLVWQRAKGEAKYKFHSIAVGDVIPAELAGKARMMRAVDAISFERGRESLLRLDLVSFINQLIDNENCTQAVYDERFEKFFAVNSLRKDEMQSHEPVGLDPLLTSKLRVTSVTDEQAKKCIVNEFMRLLDADDTKVVAEVSKQFSKWVSEGRKLKKVSVLADPPKPVEYKKVYA